MKNKNLLLLLSLLVVGCSSHQLTQPEQSPKQEQESPAVPSPGAPKEGALPQAPALPDGPVNLAGCPAKGQYTAIDLAEAADDTFLRTIRQLGFETVIRYYDWPGQESLAGKIPKDDEIARIRRSGLKFMGVFQHFNSSLSTFTAARGVIDAGKALGLASKWKQPKGSAIYFGVDGDFSGADQAKVKAYFSALVPIIRDAGFRVGMYGSGGNCKMLKANSLVDGNLCWIAASSWGWSGTKAILEENNGFALAQKVNQRCGGKSVDFNRVLIPDFGQWTIP